MIIDEAAFIDQGLFYEVILPMMLQDNVALLAVSTALDENNYYSELTSLTDGAGNPVFVVKHLVLSCAKCIAAKREGCPHIVRDSPPWKSEAKQELLEQIYGESRRTTMLRETQGAVAGDANLAFELSSLNRFFARAPYNWAAERGAAPPRFIVIGYDPGAGVSETSITAVTLHRNQIVVCLSLSLLCFVFQCCYCYESEYPRLHAATNRSIELNPGRPSRSPRPMAASVSGCFPPRKLASLRWLTRVRSACPGIAVVVSTSRVSVAGSAKSAHRNSAWWKVRSWRRSSSFTAAMSMPPVSSVPNRAIARSSARRPSATATPSSSPCSTASSRSCFPSTGGWSGAPTTSHIAR